MTEIVITTADLTDGTTADHGADAPTGRVIPLRPESANSASTGREHAALALESMASAVIIADQDRVVTYLNPEAERITGWRCAEARGEPLERVVHLVAAGTRERLTCGMTDGCRERHPEDLTGGVVLVRHDQSTLAISESTAPLRDHEGFTHGMVVMLQDATQRRRAGKRLYYEATHDPLTGLVNRRAFERHLSRVSRTPATLRRRHALIFLDLDRFKLVNDYCGHDAGNELLRKVASLLRGQVRRHDLVARLGGDEFAALLENCPPHRAAGIADGMRQSLAALHFFPEGRRVTLGASAGLLLLPARRVRAADLLRAVDAASYRAKHAGGNRVEVASIDVPASRSEVPARGEWRHVMEEERRPQEWSRRSDQVEQAG